MRFHPLTLLLSVGLVYHVSCQQYKCPEDNGFFPDSRQCDVYFECIDNIAEKKTCPDGLLFDLKNPNHEKCDLPFNVDCADRTELQVPQPSLHCPRANGFFTHEDPNICEKFYNCVDGKANELTCPPGLIYDDVVGTCAWRHDNLRDGCAKGIKEKLPDGFQCPDEEVLGPNGRPIPHPTFPHPDDCQQFYICRNSFDPQPGSCPPGTVYNDISYQCDDPENVPGCENWFNEDGKKNQPKKIR